LIIGGLFYAVEQERGRAKAMIDLALAVFGGVYIGWLGGSLWLCANWMTARI
jgi:hypothetical protein